MIIQQFDLLEMGRPYGGVFRWRGISMVDIELRAWESLLLDVVVMEYIATHIREVVVVYDWKRNLFSSWSMRCRI